MCMCMCMRTLCVLRSGICMHALNLFSFGQYYKPSCSCCVSPQVQLQARLKTLFLSQKVKRQLELSQLSSEGGKHACYQRKHGLYQPTLIATYRQHLKRSTSLTNGLHLASTCRIGPSLPINEALLKRVQRVLSGRRAISH